MVNVFYLLGGEDAKWVVDDLQSCWGDRLMHIVTDSRDSCEISAQYHIHHETIDSFRVAVAIASVENFSKKFTREEMERIANNNESS